MSELHEFHYDRVTGFLHYNGLRVRLTEIGFYREKERSGPKRGEKILSVEVIVQGVKVELPGLTRARLDELMSESQARSR